jgi:DNA polymerase I-like protein with 3'-5' exonuclease and polymerase domains
MPKSTFDSVGFQEFIDDNVQDLVKKMEWMKDTEMVLCESIAQLTDFINSVIASGNGTKKPYCCLDLETTGLNTRLNKDGIPIEKIVGIALAYNKNKGIYIPVNHKEGKECNLPEKKVLEEIKRLVRCVIIIVHNAKFDLQFLKNYGIVIDYYEDFEDTIILARLYDAGQKEIGLKHLSFTYLGRKMLELKEVTSGTNKLDLVHPKSCYVYAASDSVCTFGLFEFFINQPIIIEQMKVYCLEKRLVPVVMQMEANLVLIDKEYLSKEKTRIAEKLEGLKKEVQAIAKKDFNVGSTQQLGKVLFEELGYEYPEKKKTASGLYMTDTATLEKIADKYPMVKHIITIRKLEKTLGTYIENLLNNCDEEGLIKLGFSQNGTDTGRFSSPGGKGLHEDGYCGVNIQSIPANYDEHVPDVRKAFRARPGKKIVACDFSGEELRVAANLSKEKKWVDEFLYGSADLHTATGKTVFKKEEISKAERQIAKCVAKGTLIASDRGWIPIEELHDNDKVITHTGELRCVTKIWDMGTKPGVQIITSSGQRITCGVNHRFLTTEDKWVRAEDLQSGQLIKTASCEKMSPTNVQRFHFNFWDKGNNRFVSEDLPYVEINALWSRLLGYLMGDGSIHTNSANIVCSDEFEDVKKDIVEIATKLGLYPRIRNSQRLKMDGTKGRVLYNIQIGSRVLVRFFREIGFTGRREWKEEEKFPGGHKSCKIFRVPKVIFMSPKNIAKEFLVGLFETDGTVEKTQTSVTTKDRNFAEDIILLLSSFGIKARIANHESKKYNRMYYKVCLGVHASKKFREEINFISEKKRARLQALVTRSENHPRPGDFTMKWVTEIRSVTPIGDISLMDLTVEDDHTYVAQGLVTHNTLNFQILYGSGPRGIAEQAKISEMEARRAVDGFLIGLPQLAEWIRNERKKARKFKKAKTPFGRIRPFHMFYDSGDKGMEAHADRAAVNFMVQGCLKGSEKVLTNKGYLPIIEVKKLQESGEILKVWTGTSWETFDVIDRGPWQLATLELHNGMTLECDTRHQVLVRDGNTYDFKHFLNLKKGDLVCTTYPQEIIYGNGNVSPDSYSDNLLKASLEIRQKFLKNLNFNEYYSVEQLKNIQLIAWSSGIPLHLNNDGLKLEETESISEYFLSPIKSLYKIDQVENTYTLSVHSPLHRFDSAGIISKNSCADIMKIVMVRVSNWIKSNGLADEIKMLITMHDEIVFEMPENKLDEYIPQINDLMGLKDVLQDNLGWSVPLTIDAEYGDSWHVDHDFFKEHPELKNAKANIEFHSNTQVIETPVLNQNDPASDSTSSNTPEDAPLLIPDSPAVPDSSSQSIHLNSSIQTDATQAISLENEIQTENGGEEIFYRLKELSKINLLRLNEIITFLTDDCEKLFYKGPKAILRIQDKEGNVLSVSNLKVRTDSFYSLARFFGL